LPNKYKNCLTDLSLGTKAQIIQFYLQPNSQKATVEKFGLTLHGLKKLLLSKNVCRDKYSPERNKMISEGIKKTLNNNPDILQTRINRHLGSKRSLESKKKMQEAAWKRMASQPNNFVSKAEKQFGNFLESKLGLSITRQHRIGLKPFDFLVDGRVLVEFDGPHHYDENYYMCKSGQVDIKLQRQRDNQRKLIAEKIGMKLVVVQQRDVNKKMELKGDLLHKFMSELGYESV